MRGDGKPFDPFAPFFDALRTGAEIGNVCGNRRDFGAQGARQTARRDNGRQMPAAAALRHDRADAFDPRQQRRQFRLHFEHDAWRRLRARRRHVARKLDGIAQALFGMDQDGLARERIFAEPQRLAEASPARHSAAQPARLVGFKAAPYSPSVRSDSASLCRASALFLSAASTLPNSATRLLMAVERLQGGATPDTRGRIIRPQRQRTIEGFDRLLVAAKARERRCPVEKFSACGCAARTAS